MFGSIVVGTDGSDTAKEAVRQAVELAKSLGGELLLVSAYQPSAPATAEARDPQWMVSAPEQVSALLKEAAASAEAAGVAVQTFRGRRTSPHPHRSCEPLDPQHGALTRAVISVRRTKRCD